MMRYSATTMGFYADDMDYVNLPDDLVEITDEYHGQLIAAQAQGAAIEPDADGVPQAVFSPAPTEEGLLAAERATMNPFYTAFRFAMKATPATGFSHLLDKVTATVAAARATDPFSDLVIWADSVTQIVRLHPDMETFRVLFGLSETQLDDLCRLALQIEVGS